LTEYIWNTKKISFKFVFRKEALSNYKILSSNFISIIFLVQLIWQFISNQQDSQAVPQSIVNSDLKSDLNQFTNTFPESVKLAIQRKTVDLATEYNQNSIHSLTNLLLI
jgi:hypothetical protein